MNTPSAVSRTGEGTVLSSLPAKKERTPGEEGPLQKPSLDRRFVVPCQVCGRGYRRITPSHLWFRHHLRMKAYRDRFPKAPLLSDEMVREMSEYMSSSWEARGRHWTPERVRRALRKDWDKGLPLNAESVQGRYSRLYGAAWRHLGSWDQALRHSGLDPDLVRRRGQWTRESVLRALRKADLEGSLCRRGGALMHAAARVFGSWRDALQAAGLPVCRAPRVAWTRALVRSAVRDRARLSFSLRASDVHDQAPGLWRAARRLFVQGWPNLVASLGLPYSGRKIWDRPGVLRGIRRAARDHPLLRKRDVQQSCPGLVSAGVRWFGSWGKAVGAAGRVLDGSQRSGMARGASRQPSGSTRGRIPLGFEAERNALCPST